MRYAFIINPVSGQGKGAERIVEALDDLMARDSRDIKYYMTDGEGYATELARNIYNEAKAAGEEVYIYACGGDGTINEVANGLAGLESAYMGFMPVGSGNDFVRNFEDQKGFNDIARQLHARPHAIDVLEFSYEHGGETVTRKYVNGINIGFDGNTAILAHELKELPGVSGTFSYILALIRNLVLKKGEDLRIIADGEPVYDGRLLLCTAANGGFCGGGFESCPYAELDDGLIELLVVRNLTRIKFVKLVPKYKVGKLFDIPGVDELVEYRQAREIEILPNNGSMKFVADGEIFETGRIRIKMLDKALNVLVPRR